jgi:hypothetical protein
MQRDNNPYTDSLYKTNMGLATFFATPFFQVIRFTF